MTSYIFDKSGKCISQSHNLRGLYRAALRFKGVTKISVTAADYSNFSGANVRIDYVGGAYGETIFLTYSIAAKWAFSLSDTKGTYWTGCEVFAPDAELDEFTRAYIRCALWSSTDDDGNAFDENYSEDDISTESRASIIAECHDFQRTYKALLKRAYKKYSISGAWSVQEQAGHDFWLTRCGHGAGFWDRDLNKVGDQLSEAARLEGNCDLYVNDSGQVECT